MTEKKTPTDNQPTSRLTDQPTNRQDMMKVHMGVTIPIMFITCSNLIPDVLQLINLLLRIKLSYYNLIYICTYVVAIA